MSLSRSKILGLQAGLFYQCFALGTFLRHVFVKPSNHDFILAVLIASMITGLGMLYVAISERGVIPKKLYNFYVLGGVLPFTVFIWIYLYTLNNFPL